MRSFFAGIAQFLIHGQLLPDTHTLSWTNIYKDKYVLADPACPQPDALLCLPTLFTESPGRLAASSALSLSVCSAVQK